MIARKGLNRLGLVRSINHNPNLILICLIVDLEAKVRKSWPKLVEKKYPKIKPSGQSTDY